MSKNSKDIRQTERTSKGGVAPGGAEVVVNGYSEGWLRRGFPWIYRDEIVRARGELAPGAVVKLRSEGGATLGVGLADGGKVAVRRFREDEGEIDVSLVRERLIAALRRRCLPPMTTAWRWLHAENDDMPGVRLDVWGQELTLTLDGPGLLPLVQALQEEARAIFSDTIARTGLDNSCRAVHLCWRGAPGEESALAGLSSGRVWGEAVSPEVEVLEAGTRLKVRPADGFDAGLYCDMRELRAWMAPWWRGKRVLNTFAFTGAFTVAAALGGAREVLSVDLSAPSLARLEENLRLNSVDPAAHPCWDMDVFKALDRLRRKEERFDVIIADPPSFAHGPDGLWSASRDFPRLVAACLRVLAPGGWLIAATNNGAVSPKAFQEQVMDGGQRAGRRLRLIHQGSPPPDFPAALHFPESRYLKAWVLEA